MPFDLQTWKTETANNLQSIGDWLRRRRDRDLPYVAYGALSAAAIFPLAMMAAQTGQFYPVLAKLAEIVGDKGADIFSDKIRKWKDRADELHEADIEQWVDAEVAGNADLRTALDAILQAVDAIPAAKTRLSENDRAAFAEMLSVELKELGSHVEYHAIAGDRSLVQQGEGNVAAVDGGVGIGGGVKGNVTVTNIVTNYVTESKQPADEEALREQIAAYLSWVVAHNSTIELRGIKRKGEQVVQLDLETVYVPLAAETARGGERLSLDEVLPHGNHLVITGGPGSGKTTVLQHMAYTLSLAADTDNFELARKKLGVDQPLPLPIFVPLSHFALYRRNLPPDTPGERKTLAAFISDFLQGKQAPFSLPKDFFKLLLQFDQKILLLLDGLDEVPNENERAEVRAAIEELLDGRKNNLRLVVTCRTAAYKGQTAIGRGFQEINVLPLDESHIKNLITQAYTSIIKNDEVERTGRIDDLITGIKKLETNRRRQYGDNAKPLITSPLLVRMLLIVHYSNNKLPEQRAELYKKATDGMLKPDYNLDTEIANRIGGLVGENEKSHREMVQYLAYHMHQRGEKQGREIDETDLRDILNGHPVYAQHTEALIELTRQRGTLLEERLRQYRFLHLAFQEYMVARYFAEVVRSEDAIVRELEEGNLLTDSWWREVIILITGYLSIDNPTAATAFVRRLAGLENPSPGLTEEQRLAAAELAGASLLDWQTAPVVLRNEVSKLLEKFFNEAKSPRRRVEIGNFLAKYGDPRPGVGVRDGVPEMVFCYIPAGDFWMGDGRKQHLQTGLNYGYWQGKYPVTVGQWRAYVEAGHKPKDEDSLRDEANRPVRYVTWNEAVAYCRWLTEEWRARKLIPDNWAVRLPSEAEWEKGARGGVEIPVEPVAQVIGRDKFRAETGVELITNPHPKRHYPWGNKIDANKVNYEETGIGGTSAVGSFPGGAGPYGCEDMSGNVWEWCSTKWKEKAYPFKVEDEWTTAYLAGGDTRVVRGGAFCHDEDFVRSAFRYGGYPYNWLRYLGFRVMLSPKSSEK